MYKIGLLVRKKEDGATAIKYVYGKTSSKLFENLERLKQDNEIIAYGVEEQNKKYET